MNGWDGGWGEYVTCVWVGETVRAVTSQRWKRRSFRRPLLPSRLPTSLRLRSLPQVSGRFLAQKSSSTRHILYTPSFYYLPCFSTTLESLTLPVRGSEQPTQALLGSVCTRRAHHTTADTLHIDTGILGVPCSSFPSLSTDRFLSPRLVPASWPFYSC